eukprot:472115_1
MDEEPLNEQKSEMPNINGVADLSSMSRFEMEDVLNNIEYRYCKMKTKHCYTSISTILLSVNPYQDLPIYGDDVIKQFHESQNNNHSLTSQLCKPHPFAVAARSYKRMIIRKCHQSIIPQNAMIAMIAIHILTPFLCLPSLSIDDLKLV